VDEVRLLEALVTTTTGMLALHRTLGAVRAHLTPLTIVTRCATCYALCNGAGGHLLKDKMPNFPQTRAGKLAYVDKCLADDALLSRVAEGSQDRKQALKRALCILRNRAWLAREGLAQRSTMIVQWRHSNTAGVAEHVPALREFALHRCRTWPTGGRWQWE
jgi:hypothetical protein